MREQDFEPFVAMLDDVASLLNHGKTLTSGHKSMFFRAMSKHSLDAVRSGFDCHVKDPQRGRFMPAPADILAQIEGLAADDGRPGPEEAWACALRSADEDNTVVWTEEMAQAWAIASIVMLNGDEVGARMAFKECYARLTDEARRARRPAHWSASLGFDAQKRTEVLAQAHAAGRLAAPDALALPAPAEALAALSASSSMPAPVRDKLASLRSWLTRGSTGPTPAEADRARMDELKATAARMATERLGVQK